MADTRVRHTLMAHANRWPVVQIILAVLLLPWTALGQPVVSMPKTGPPPAWVEWVAPVSKTSVKTEHESGGQILTLFDTQINTAQAENFVHVVKDITTQAGVQSGANLEFSWDPSFQELTFHQITVWRGAKKLDRLDLAKFRVIQQETDLYRQIYNGTLSALLFVEDVRPGDRIEYAYTLRGENPTLKNHFSNTLIAGGAAMGRRHIRLLWPEERVLHVRSHNTTVQPQVRTHDGIKDYTWDFHDLPSIDGEDQVPSWFVPYPWIQLSEFSSWSEVASWAEGLYVSTHFDAAELKEEIAKLKRAGAGTEEILQSALELTQNNIRYLGIEFGPNSYRPTDPVTVLRRRFGDCKDKAFLLCTLLRGLGYDATPVLVATGFRHTLPDLLPTPHDFDHVIVRVVVRGTDYWLDPTRLYQHGPISQRHQPAYGYGLLVRSGEKGLISIPASNAGAPETLTTEAFQVGGQKTPTRLSVTSTFKGHDAEWMRAILSSEGRETLAKDYLNDYAQRYPGVALSGLLTVDDSPNSDTLTIRHAYSITNFWVLSTDKLRYTCQFYPLGIHACITRPATAIRSMPMEISFPRRRTVQTGIDLPINFQLSNFTNTITGPGAELRTKGDYRGRTMWLDYEYKSLTNFIPTSLTTEHLSSLDRMENALGYVLTWPNKDSPGTREFNWPLFKLAAIYAALLAMGTGLFCWRQCRRASATMKPPVLNHELNGINGWLILVAIGLVLRPFVLLTRVGRFFGTYWLWHWHALTVPGGTAYHPAYSPLLTFELLGNVTLLILSLFVIVLFFQKRPSFPRWFIVYLLLNTIFVGLDYAAVQIIKPTSPSLPPELLGMILGSCIWIPYMCKSRRVQITFERTALLRTAPVALPPLPRVEPVVKPVARPKPPLRHCHGGAHMIFLWLCVLALPLDLLDTNLRSVWTKSASFAAFVLSVVFAIVAGVKQSNSDMPRKIKCLPCIFGAMAAVFLCSAVWGGLATAVIEIHSGKKIPPKTFNAVSDMVSVVFFSLFSCLGFAGLALLIRYQSGFKNSPAAASGQNNLAVSEESETG